MIHKGRTLFQPVRDILFPKQQNPLHQLLPFPLHWNPIVDPQHEQFGVQVSEPRTPGFTLGR